MKIVLVFVLFVVGILLLSNENLVFGQASNSTTYTVQQNDQVLTVLSNTEGKEQVVSIPSDQLLFNVFIHYDQNNNFKSITMSAKPELQSFYNQVGFFGRPHDIVFIYPIFTQAAYSANGFYDYYNGKCGTSCLTVDIPTKIHGGYSSSLGGAFVLTLLNYSYVTDIDVDKNPDILKKYKRVIVLHNEYVTKKEFDAITSHPDVIYLYPNALYAEVVTNYDSNTITLVHGHGYPDQSIKNGFDWTSDNSKYEYNVFCNQWTYYTNLENHAMLNCYPEYSLLTSREMLSLLQSNDPTGLYDDTANWLRYSGSQYTHTMLQDFDINGTYVPVWVATSGLMMENGEISKNEFLVLLKYLNSIGIVH